MLADYVFKGIDNLFYNKLSLDPNKKKLTKQLIRQNLHNVVRKGADKNHTNIENNQSNIVSLKKSRLKQILQHNKQQKIRSVVKRNKDDKQNSPYTKIQRTNSMLTLKNSQINASQSSVSQLRKDTSVITYYREQRKTIQKSRISQNSILSKQKSRIFFNSYQLDQSKQIEREKVNVNPYKKSKFRD